MPDEIRVPLSPVAMVKKYLSDGSENPPQNSEFMNFWRACTPEEKEAYALVSAANLGLELQRA